DGTLVDTFAICYRAFRRAVERSGGRALDDAEVHALFGPSEDGMMQRVLPVGLVTGKTRVTAEMSLRHFGLDHIFEAVETDRRAVSSRPRPFGASLPAGVSMPQT